MAAAAAAADDADTSLSCVENKASTGTQCFESEFPDEDSDIEISYSREDLDAIAMVADATDQTVLATQPRGFKPIQSSSEDLGLDGACRGWRSQGQYSVESDPNGYELDLAAISPPSDIEELSLASLTGDAAAGKNTSAVKGHLYSMKPLYTYKCLMMSLHISSVCIIEHYRYWLITDNVLYCTIPPTGRTSVKSHCRHIRYISNFNKVVMILFAKLLQFTCFNESISGGGESLWSFRTNCFTVGYAFYDISIIPHHVNQQLKCVDDSR